MKENQNITLLAQRDYEMTIALKQADDVTPLDLHGCTLNWALSSIYGTTALISKTSADVSEILITDETNGVLVIFIDKADTLLLGGVPYKHELNIVDAQGQEATVLTGSAAITKSIAA